MLFKLVLFDDFDSMLLSSLNFSFSLDFNQNAYSKEEREILFSFQVQYSNVKSRILYSKNVSSSSCEML